ncbi:DUF262 domain-containing protein [Deinococcus arenicola]|uniref:DUF262 domain-containing HNH endonuclease family protein n=1 Tax=Deinococcus arenicola TaxID=2994950 RepID=A0ABU4DNZ2_9DEIO|nr:DUF262 domain-containing HNH endonuclease family protein [Deinococcus sp. ZS9-10]MDV6374154.1 DUF262 domain-containing HNH endonuclease family protein [Deinococcus sp. ZS9-10]
MANLDINNIFPTSTTSLQQFFTGRVGATYYIPLYQREYSWDNENVRQLLEDIITGVNSFADVDPDNSNRDRIKFLGTIILVREKEPYNNISPKKNPDPALPQAIDIIIDGQQRLSTLALIATQLYARLHKYKDNTHVKDVELTSAIESSLESLQAMFSHKLGRGKPIYKPLIIRGSEDQWVLTEKIEDYYPSPVTNFLARTLAAIYPDVVTPNKKADFPKINEAKSIILKNALREINSYMEKVEKAHILKDGDFLPAWELAKYYSQKELWQYDRVDLKSDVIGYEGQILDSKAKILCPVTQLLALSQFLLDRCCFTLIQPSSEEWGFDMFQSLNGTGTPLTAIETFKPLIVNAAKKDFSRFEGSEYDILFNQVDNLFKTTNKAAEKTKLTNEYLSIFSLTYSGTKLSNQFSEQRQKLIKWFPDNANGRLQFIKHLSHLASYWQRYIKFKEGGDGIDIFADKLPQMEREIATVCQLYLRDAGHTMSNTILSRYFDDPNDSSNPSRLQFAQAIKATAAFFTIWRTAQSNQSLDASYRAMFSNVLSVLKSSTLPTIDVLKEQIRIQLASEDLETFDKWYTKSKGHFGYRSGLTAICKFALFMYAHDTVLRAGNYPMLDIGNNGVSHYMTPGNWISPDFKTIEHIAPQNPPTGSNWSDSIYDRNLVNSIGNLTLLPTDINSSVGNRNWQHKWFYYSFLGLQTQQEREDLQTQAAQAGFTLEQDILNCLMEASHSKHVMPLQKLGQNAMWDADMIDARTRNICEILYERMWKWLT